jgi:hypothetical protein
MNVEIGAEAALFPEKGIYKRNCRCSAGDIPLPPIKVRHNFVEIVFGAQ